MSSTLKASLTLFLLTLMVSCNAWAEHFKLRLGDYNAFSPYMRALIVSSLEGAGHRVSVEVLPKHYGVKRIIKEVSRGNLQLVWAGRARNFKEKERFLRIDIGLTNGLKARQVLFIKASAQEYYRGVKSLAQFRALDKVAIFGASWAATRFWKSNELRFLTIEGGSSKDIVSMSLRGGRGFDYFTRGVLTAPTLLQANPRLVLEDSLLVEFDDDFIIYLGRDQQGLHSALTAALTHSVQSGHMERLLRQYFPDTFKPGLLKLGERNVIQLIR